MQNSLKYLLAVGLMAFGSTAWSDCACFCVEGELTTMCTAVEEAQDSPNLCPDTGSAICPSEIGGSDATSYDAPEADATNCRTVRVYDAIRGQYVDAKACDVI